MSPRVRTDSSRRRCPTPCLLHHHRAGARARPLRSGWSSCSSMPHPARALPHRCRRIWRCEEETDLTNPPTSVQVQLDPPPISHVRRLPKLARLAPRPMSSSSLRRLVLTHATDRGAHRRFPEPSPASGAHVWPLLHRSPADPACRAAGSCCRCRSCALRLDAAPQAGWSGGPHAPAPLAWGSGKRTEEGER